MTIIQSKDDESQDRGRSREDDGNRKEVGSDFDKKNTRAWWVTVCNRFWSCQSVIHPSCLNLAHRVLMYVPALGVQR